MNRIKTSTILLAATALVLTACSQEDGQQQNPNIISLSAAMSGQNITRASASDELQLTQFASGKSIFVEAYETGESTTYTTGNYTTGSNGAMSGSLYYPSSTSAIDICAYYPATVSSTATTFPATGTIAAQGTEAGYQGFDLMYATKLTNKAKGSTHALTFHHALTQIIVNISAGSGVADDDITSNVTAVTINNTVPVASLSITDGVITASAKAETAVADVTITGTGGTSNVGIIVPQTVAVGEFITVTYAGNSYTYSLTSAMTFAGGSTYTFNLTLSSAGLSLSSATISAWTDPYASTTPPSEFTQEITI